MIRVSTTTLEGFRLMKTMDWSSEADFIEQVRGKFVPNWKMTAGQAFGEIVADPGRYLETVYDADKPSLPTHYENRGYAFSSEDINACCESFDPNGMFEVKDTRIVRVGSLDVEVVAKVDQIHGSRIQENKAKFGQFDITFYDASLQWRTYLWVFGASEVRYNVHLFTEPEALAPGLAGVQMKSIESFRLYPYVGLESDVLRWLGAFIEWARDRGLMHYLKPFSQRAA